MPRGQAETGALHSWSTGRGAMPLPCHLPPTTGLRCSHCTRTRPRSLSWAVMAPAACRTPGYEPCCLSTTVKCALPHAVLTQRLGRQWTGRVLPPLSHHCWCGCLGSRPQCLQVLWVPRWQLWGDREGIEGFLRGPKALWRGLWPGL